MELLQRQNSVCIPPASFYLCASPSFSGCCSNNACAPGGCLDGQTGAPSSYIGAGATSCMSSIVPMAPYSISVKQTTVTVVELTIPTSAAAPSDAVFGSDLHSSQSTAIQSTSQLSDSAQTVHTTITPAVKTSTTSIHQTSSHSSQTSSASSSPTPGSSHAGAVAGGVIGGTAMAGLLAALLYFCCRKKFRVRLKVRREVEEKEEDKKRDTLIARRQSTQPGSKDGNRDLYSDPGGSSSEHPPDSTDRSPPQ